MASRDPNNRTWADDTGRFGMRMLAKYGWTAGKGLGKEEQGETQHLKVKVKEDQAGLGVRTSDDGHWQQTAKKLDDIYARLASSVPASTSGDAHCAAAPADASAAPQMGTRAVAAKYFRSKVTRASALTVDDLRGIFGHRAEPPADAQPAHASAPPVSDPLAHSMYAAGVARNDDGDGDVDDGGGGAVHRGLGAPAAAVSAPKRSGLGSAGYASMFVKGDVLTGEAEAAPTSQPAKRVRASAGAPAPSPASTDAAADKAARRAAKAARRAAREAKRAAKAAKRAAKRDAKERKKKAKKDKRKSGK